MQQYQARDHEVFNNAHSTEHYGVEMSNGSRTHSVHARLCVWMPVTPAGQRYFILSGLFLFLCPCPPPPLRFPPPPPPRRRPPPGHAEKPFFTPPPLPCAPLPSSMPDGVGCTPRGGSGGKKVLRVYGLEVQGSGRTSINMITCQPQNPNV